MSSLVVFISARSGKSKAKGNDYFMVKVVEYNPETNIIYEHALFSSGAVPGVELCRFGDIVEPKFGAPAYIGAKCPFIGIKVVSKSPYLRTDGGPKTAEVAAAILEPANDPNIPF